jgi:hypothetical protein
MDERRRGFLRTGQHPAWRSQRASGEAPRATVELWQPSDEADLPFLRGGRGPPRRSSSHVVRDNSSALPIDRKWRSNL